MDTTYEMIKPQHPFLAGFWLIAALPICMLIIFPLNEILSVGDDLYGAPTLLIMFAVHFATGYLWARALVRRSGLAENRLMNISGGLGFAAGVVGFIMVLILESSLKDALDRWLAMFVGVGNLQFGALFAPWIGLVSGFSGLALGLGLKDVKLALKLLASGFLSGLGLYLGIMFTMELLGFKVGSGRPVMLPTTLLSVWSTALMGSAIFGRMLAKSRADERSHQT